MNNELEEDVIIETSDNDLSLESIIEGLIFVIGDEGITIEQLEIVLEVSKKDIIIALDKLIDKYSNDTSTIELSMCGNNIKFLTKPTLYPYLNKLFTDTKTSILSQSALETLAIIAYKQPIEKSEIEEIRGVSADHMIRKLIARNLVKEAGRSEAPGRPFLYEVTDVFMDSFKLVSLDELPDLPMYSNNNEENLFDE